MIGPCDDPESGTPCNAAWRKTHAADPVLPRSDAAERQARYRARLRGDRCLAWSELRYDAVAAMIDRGLVSPEDSRDRRKLGEAVAGLIERLVRRGAI